MENIVLRYKNYEVVENDNALFELRKNGQLICEAVDNMNGLFATIQTEEEKEGKRALIKEQLNNINEKENTLNFLNQETKLNIREISYEELINNRFGFTQKGYLINEGNKKRLVNKDELIDLLLNYYNDRFTNYFETHIKV